MTVLACVVFVCVWCCVVKIWFWGFKGCGFVLCVLLCGVVLCPCVVFKMFVLCCVDVFYLEGGVLCVCL